eukprot:CAMPEP_0197448194 /NCGR_PEP_ID=MMETSP1175-20131217/16415_1 /TAXON_ID=1003142 /ORGANISM="Triceratium dubium, Strain CCMP147" /LENGTH=32 /DNA_ID= /DNA_START= /DNA_END= /DNA_ORIENTATION=
MDERPKYESPTCKVFLAMDHDYKDDEVGEKMK